MTARNAWQIILDNDVRIELGKKDVSERLNRFLELYPLLQQTTDKRVDYVDLRYSSGAAVAGRHCWLMLHRSYNKDDD